MKEFITANGTIFECTNVSTGMDSITFTVECLVCVSAEFGCGCPKG